MTLLRDLVAHLEARGIANALIGGVALAAHGVARATLDSDLLVVDTTVLEERFWAGAPPLAEREIRRGEGDDPLAGIVRCRRDDEVVDIVVGRHAWQREILARRARLVLAGQVLPVVDTADLVLLKLFAGGPQDLLDVKLLVAADPDGLPAQVESRLAGTAHEMQQAWSEIRRSPSL